MSPERLIAEAIKRGYAGIGITDHNTTSAFNEIIDFEQKSDIVILKGIEWTTFFGHITVFNEKNPIDWRKITQDNINETLNNACHDGAVITIAHPKRMGAPHCAGCYFDYKINDYSSITCFEVFSQSQPHKEESNLLAIKKYDEIMSQGYKLTAVYGYDWHTPDKDLCYATTYIGCKEKKQTDIFSSLKKGDTFVSLGLLIKVKVNDRELAFGEEVLQGETKFDLKVEKEITYCERFNVLPRKIIFKGSALDEEISYPITEQNIISLKLKAGYIRIEVEGEIEQEKEKTLLFTSPFYVKGEK